MDYSFEKSERYGLIGTIIFHVLLIILFLFAGLTYLEPPPPEEGILINFGTVDQGSGTEQAQSSERSTKQVEKEEIMQETPSRSVDQEVITQSTEEAPRINAEKVESIRKTEEEKEEPKPSKELSEAASKWKSKSENKSASDGTTGKEGDQGNERGSLDSRNYTGGSGGDGISYDLSGRSMVVRPIINDKSQEEGKVVVDIIVDNNGKVVRAKSGVRGSTTTSQRLYRIAKEAAMRTEFNVSRTAPEQQKGQITFIFLVKG